MSATRELPCPHCGAPMLIRRAQFFPTRRHQFQCESCRQMSLLPLSSVLVGVAVMLVFMGFALAFAQPILKPTDGMETVWDFVQAAAVFVAIAFGASWLASWVCGRTVDHLDPWPRPKRRAGSNSRRTE